MPSVFSAKVLGYLLLLLAIDVCLTPFLGIGLMRPIFLYLMVLYAAFIWHWAKTIPMALAVGFLWDVTGSTPLGVQTVSLVLAAWLLDLFVQKAEREAFVIRLIAAFLFVLLASLFTLGLTDFLGAATPAFGVAMALSLVTALTSSALLPLFFHLSARFFQDRMVLRQYEFFK